MYEGKIVFAQVMDHLPMHSFHRCVERYRGQYKVQSFSCLDQYLCMAFAQITYRESLRDIEACLRAQRAKLYHMGIRGHGGIMGTGELITGWLQLRLRSADRKPSLIRQKCPN